MRTKMEESSPPPLKGEETQSSVPSFAEYSILHQLELKYWALRKPRKTVRYTAAFALAGQLAAALLCFISSPWGENAEQRQRLRFIGCVLLTTLSAGCLFLSIGALIVAWLVSGSSPC